MKTSTSAKTPNYYGSDDDEDDEHDPFNLLILRTMREGTDDDQEPNARPFNHKKEMDRLTEKRKDAMEILERDIWLINCAISDRDIAEHVCAATLIQNDNLFNMARIAKDFHRQGKPNCEIREYFRTKPCFPSVYRDRISQDEIDPEDKIAFKQFYYRQINESALKDVIEYAAQNSYGYKPSAIFRILAKHYPDEISIPSEVASMRSAEDARQWMRNIEERQVKRIKTSSLQINKYTNGGYKHGCVYGFAAPTGGGKSIHLCWASADLTRAGYSVLFISTEMLRDEVFARVNRAATSSKTNADAALLYEKLSESSNFNGYDVWCAEELRSTIADIEEKAQARRYDIIIVDYGDKLSAGQKTDNEYQRQGVVFSQLARLAKKLDVPILVATQQNRKALTDSDAGLESVGDSIDKTRPLEMLFSIPYNDTRKKPELRYEKNLVIRKNRDGVRDVEIFLDIDYQSWSLSEPDYARATIEANMDLNPQDLYYKIVDARNAAKKQKVKSVDESDCSND